VFKLGPGHLSVSHRARSTLTVRLHTGVRLPILHPRCTHIRRGRCRSVPARSRLHPLAASHSAVVPIPPMDLKGPMPWEPRPRRRRVDGPAWPYPADARIHPSMPSGSSLSSCSTTAPRSMTREAHPGLQGVRAAPGGHDADRSSGATHPEPAGPSRADRSRGAEVNYGVGDGIASGVGGRPDGTMTPSRFGASPARQWNTAVRPS
jgi:hypothetical protein